MTNPTTSSGLKNADAAIQAGAGRLRGVSLIGDGTNAASIVIYDNATAASGKALAKLSLKAGETYVSAVIPEEGVCVNAGIYADVTGTGAEYIVYSDLG